MSEVLVVRRRHPFFVVLIASLFMVGCNGCGEVPEDPDPDPPDGTCETVEDCDEGELCEDGTCVLAQTESCASDEDCEEGWSCNLLVGQCAEDEVIPEPICDPGVTRCADDTTVETCAADGLAWETSECGTDTPACFEGACYTCVPDRRWCAGEFARACTSDGSSYSETDCGIGGGECDEGVCFVCEPGDRQCSDDGLSLMRCNATGTQWEYDWCAGTCDPETLTCEESNECQQDDPPVCRGDLVMTCGDEGELEEAQDCAAEGSVCRNGTCQDLCEEAVTSNSYIGCEYWPVALSNSQVDEVYHDHYAVVLSNPHQGTTATVAVYRHGETDPFLTSSVAGGAVETIRLPWNAMNAVTEFDDDAREVHAQTRRGHTAYRLTSTVPLTAYQFNPVVSHVPSGCQNNNDCPGGTADRCDQELGACIRSDYSYTNDASLLLPAHILGDGGGVTYVAVTIPHMEFYRVDSFSGPFADRHTTFAMPAFVTIAAVGEGTTQVTIRSRGAIAEGDGVGEIDPGSETVLELEQFEVVQLATRAHGEPDEHLSIEQSGGGATTRIYLREYKDSDPSGSIISADGPIALYAGADCHFVPYDTWACDHMEQQLFPFHNWGSSYVGAITMPPPGATVEVGDYFRVVAAVDGTEVSFVPSVHGDVTLGAGDWIEFASSQDFVVQSQGNEHPIMVTQFMVGQNAHGEDADGIATAEMGDPSMILAVPVEQYRDNFVFTTTETIARNYINVVRPTGQAVVHNGQVLPGDCWRSIPGTDFETCRYEVPQDVHTHRVVSDANVAVTVYGYDRYVSYGYPAGLDLQQTIEVNPGW